MSQDKYDQLVQRCNEISMLLGFSTAVIRMIVENPSYPHSVLKEQSDYLMTSIDKLYYPRGSNES